MIKICPTCGTEFGTNTNRKRFCSATCRKKIHAKPPKNPNKICPGCGKNFVASGKRLYCSIDCRKNYLLARDRNPIQPKTCAICGNEFKTSRTNKKYCSRKCAKKAAKKRIYVRLKARPVCRFIYEACPYCGKMIQRLTISNEVVSCD